MTDTFGPDYYAHRLGDRTGRIRPPEDGDAVSELRDGLDTLRPGRRLVFGTRTSTKQSPLTVTGFTLNRGALMWLLEGPSGAKYRILDRDDWDRPRVEVYKPGTDAYETWSDGQLYTLLIVTGETGPDLEYRE